MFIFKAGRLEQLKADSRWCQKLAVEANAVLFDVGYRLAPEHKFPTAIEDSWTFLKYLSTLHRLGSDVSKV